MRAEPAGQPGEGAGLPAALTRLRLVLSGPRLHTVLFTVGLLGLSTVLWVGAAPAGGRLRVPGPVLPWWGLAPLFTAAEVFVLHVQVRREARTISLSDVPLALGLFYAAPSHLLLARLLGGIAAYTLWRRQHLLKVAFNTACLLLEVWIVVWLFRSLVGPPAISLRSWAAATVATAVAGAVSATVVTVVIALNEDLSRMREIWGSARSGFGVAALVTLSSMLGVDALAFDPRAGALVTVLGALILFGFRAYAQLSRRHMSLERLYQFTRVVTSSPEMDEVLRSLLLQARALLHGQHVEAVFVLQGRQGEDAPGRLVITVGDDGSLHREYQEPGPEGDPVQLVLDHGEPLLLLGRSRRAVGGAWLRSRGFDEAVLTPLRRVGAVTGVLLVADRLGDVTTFDEDDVRLLETVANHASVALENGRLVEQLRHEALHDLLTGLPNRLALQRRLRHESEALTAGGHGFAVLLIDLNGFKDVNDVLGHHQGDLLLRVVAERLQRALPPRGMVARLGGDEFAVVLPDVEGQPQALRVAQRMAEDLDVPIDLESTRVTVRGAVGVALAPLDGTDPATLLKHADVAMYAAKKDGRGVVLYDHRLSSGAPSLLRLAVELQEATAEPGQLVAYLQPQARVSDGCVVGLEALARWNHPRQGLLLPDAFIGMAERGGQVLPLTWLVLRDALDHRAAWPEQARHLQLAVNLSAPCLLDAGLVPQLQVLLHRYRVPASRLTLEITESSVMTDPDRAIDTLHALNELGVRLSVDDFGTGYASLTYLKRLPVHEVKIDRSFVRDVCDNADDLTIVRSVIDLGTNLGLDVVAEGVEDQQTWDLLRELGCTTLQGYGLAEPMPGHELPGWLLEHESASHAGPWRLPTTATRPA